MDLATSNYTVIVAQVARELSLPFELVDKAYKGYWTAIREAIQTLPLKENLTEEEFQKLQTSFNIPSIGKLNCDYERFQGIKKRFTYLQKLRQNVNTEEN